MSWSAAARRAVWVGGIAGVLACVGTWSTPVLRQRTALPASEREAAVAALAEARDRGAAHLAPETLRRAEAELAAARTEERRQSLRLWPIRDYRSAATAFMAAEVAASAAEAEAEVHEVELRQAAEEAVTKAQESVSRAGSLLAPVGEQSALRVRLAQARLQLREARIRASAGSYQMAVELAESSAAKALAVAEQARDLLARYVAEQELSRWNRWVSDTVEWSRRTGQAAIVVNKDAHTLTLFEEGRPVLEFPVDLGTNSVSGKRRSGDEATPEGRYRIVTKKSAGATAYYKALLLDYPNEEDRRRFEVLRREGELPAGSHPGGLIEIHGKGGRERDWTQGCVALRNEHIDPVFARVGTGTPVTIIGGGGEGGVYSELVRSHDAEVGSAADH